MAVDKISVQAWMFAVEYHQTEHGFMVWSKRREVTKMNTGKRERDRKKDFFIPGKINIFLKTVQQIVF